MATSKILYSQPDTGTGIATETFTEDAEIKHFERVVMGHKPFNDMEKLVMIGGPEEGNFIPHIPLVDGSSANWTASAWGSGVYYYSGDLQGPVNLFADSLPIAVEINGIVTTEATGDELLTDQWKVTDEDNLGEETLYVKLAVGNPDDQVEGYIIFYYAPPCSGASVVRVMPWFSSSESSCEIVPILYQTNIKSSPFSGRDLPIFLDPVSTSAINLDMSNGIIGIMNMFPGYSFDIDTKGAQFFALAVKTPPATGFVFFLAMAV